MIQNCAIHFIQQQNLLQLTNKPTNLKWPRCNNGVQSSTAQTINAWASALKLSISAFIKTSTGSWDSAFPSGSSMLRIEWIQIGRRCGPIIFCDKIRKNCRRRKWIVPSVSRNFGALCKTSTSLVEKLLLSSCHSSSSPDSSLSIRCFVFKFIYTNIYKFLHKSKLCKQWIL